MAEALRTLMPRLNTSEIGAETAGSSSTAPMPADVSTSPVDAPRFGLPQLASIPEAVRMMAVSSIFQRFPRMVRDISRKLGKDVQLVLEGEQTEADKNIIESLDDPLLTI